MIKRMRLAVDLGDMDAQAAVHAGTDEAQKDATINTGPGGTGRPTICTAAVGRFLCHNQLQTSRDRKEGESRG